jgi:hypothetical protein
MLSIAGVQITVRISLSNCRNGTNSAHALVQSPMMAGTVCRGKPDPDAAASLGRGRGPWDESYPRARKLFARRARWAGARTVMSTMNLSGCPGTKGGGRIHEKRTSAGEKCSRSDEERLSRKAGARTSCNDVAAQKSRFSRGLERRIRFRRRGKLCSWKRQQKGRRNALRYCHYWRRRVPTTTVPSSSSE